jgi:death-on-curing protein
MDMLRNALHARDQVKLSETAPAPGTASPERGVERLDLAARALGQEIGVEFLTVKEVVLMHAELVDRYGGAQGIREPRLLESAVMRPLQSACYGDAAEHDLPKLAASLAYGLVSDHVFVDGNKRIGFAAAAVFLARNRCEFSPDPAETMRVFRALAAHKMDETTLSHWFERSIHPSEDASAKRWLKSAP